MIIFIETYLPEIMTLIFVLSTLIFVVLWRGKISEYNNIREEKFFLEGEGKNMFMNSATLEAKNNSLIQERDELREKVSTFEHEKTLREEKFAERVEKLEHAREKLEKEQCRVIRADEEARKILEASRDRLWNDHENTVVSQMKDACQSPQIGFRWYDNTNLPSEFDGTVKPDFLVEFLGQYIIFDAKKSKNPKTYIDAQVKATAQKCKKNKSIYTTVFFVMPADEVAELRKKYFFEEGFTFYVLSPESIFPVLSLFKKITEYKNIEDFNPQERESIVSLFAHYDKHISFHNAANFVMAQKSLELMESKNNLPQQFREDITTKKQGIKDIRLNPSEIKKFSENATLQKKTITDLTQPTAGVELKDMEGVEKLL